VTNAQDKASDVVLFALGLIETGYRFGGKNPEAGLDCSGMVSYVYEKSVDLRLAGSAADLARQGKPVPPEHSSPATWSSSTPATGRAPTSASTSATTASCTPRTAAARCAPKA
jgi:cell wall-associated NlpC family hydrolase